MDIEKILPCAKLRDDYDEVAYEAAVLRFMNWISEEKPLFKHIEEKGLTWWNRAIRMVRNSVAQEDTRGTENCPYCGVEVAEGGGLEKHYQFHPSCKQQLVDDPNCTSDFEDGNGGTVKRCPFQKKSCKHPSATGYKCAGCRARYGDTAYSENLIFADVLRRRAERATEKAQGAKHIPHQEWKRECLKGNSSFCKFPKFRTKEGWCQGCMDAVKVCTQKERSLIKIP